MPEIFIFLQVVQLIWLIGLTVLTWARKPGIEAKAAADAIDADLHEELQAQRLYVEAELREQGLRVRDIEVQLRFMATSKDVGKLDTSVHGLDQRLAAIAASVLAQQNTVVRIENWLLNNSASLKGGA